MAEYLIQDTTLDDIADAINAKTGGSSAMTPAEMVTEIAAIPSGTTITDGIIIKTTSSSGAPKTIDFYGSKIGTYMFGIARNDIDCGWKYVSEIDFKSSDIQLERYAFRYNRSLTRLETSAITHYDPAFQFNSNSNETATFQGSRLEVLSLPEFVGFLNHNDLAECVYLTTVYLPKVTRLSSYGTAGRGCVKNCTALTQAQFGSVGYPVTFVDYNPFAGCTNTALVLTLYCLGSYVDTALTNSRYGATNATIIIKAAKDTEYNGTTYAAGDTILTSEVTA